MKAYWISLYTKVNDQENLKKYAETVTPIIKSYGGLPLVRGCLLYTSPSPRDQ